MGQVLYPAPLFLHLCTDQWSSIVNVVKDNCFTFQYVGCMPDVFADIKQLTLEQESQFMKSVFIDNFLIIFTLLLS